MKALQFYYVGMGSQLLGLALAKLMRPGFEMTATWFASWAAIYLTVAAAMSLLK